MAQTVIGIFDYDIEAQNAYQQLLDSGFSRDRIDFSPQPGVDNAGTFANDKTDTFANDKTDTFANDKNRDNDKYDNFFTNLFDSDDDARNHSAVACRSSCITVHANSKEEADRAASILDKNGAVDVNERAEQYRSGADLDTIRSSSDRTGQARTNTGDSLNVVEEEMHVGKRNVETGGVRLRSRVIERPVEEHLRLRVEHVHVERNPVNRPASEADLANFKEGTIELKEQKEVPVVSKDARVVEEIRLEKEVTERDETIRDTVRKTDVDVENIKSDKDRFTSDRDVNRPYDADDDLSRPANR